MKEVLSFLGALIIYVGFPAAGLLYYKRLIESIQAQQVPDAPTGELFWLMATYGGLLLVVLTTLAGFWSGAASLGVLYLLAGAPIVMGLIAFHQYKNRTKSKYHYWTFTGSWLYFLIAPVTLGGLFLLADYIENH